MILVFLLEEPSAKKFLDILLPRFLPQGVQFFTVPHEGKQDLERSIPRKLRGWKTPDTYFVVLRDQDGGDCGSVKERLVRICKEAGRPDTLVRIACRELESWFLGDLEAVGKAFGKKGLAKRQVERKFRDPDRLGNAAEELGGLIKGYQKGLGARAIAPYISLKNNRSQSFQAFVVGVNRLLLRA